MSESYRIHVPSGTFPAPASSTGQLRALALELAPTATAPLICHPLDLLILVDLCPMTTLPHGGPQPGSIWRLL